MTHQSICHNPISCKPKKSSLDEPDHIFPLTPDDFEIIIIIYEIERNPKT